MNSFLKIYEWFKQVDGHMLKIETENKSFEIPLSISSIPHLLGLQYVQLPNSENLRGVKLMNYINEHYSSNQEIFSRVPLQYQSTVSTRISTIKSFLENLDKGILVQNTHPNTQLKSQEFIVQINPKQP